MADGDTKGSGGDTHRNDDCQGLKDLLREILSEDP